ncbi:FACT complex subunit SSRP1 [Sesamum angolense]|uniref:FACT complex subunit SSRP1 n=1 Tax=Sesamum angolense TaxID=2727404 RepID=A0AAE1WGQ6_9LAMI|nr:FACT complex subunit SSRP1 [Sesamum angolense]
MADGHLFNSISLGGRGGTNPGQLKVHSGGVIWKKQGGGKAVEVDKSDLLGLTWMKVPRSNQLGVRTKDGLHYKFTGFRDQDVASLTAFFQSNFGTTPEEKQLSFWLICLGFSLFPGNTLTFLCGSKQAFEISLADVAQTQLQGKNDVMLEFHVDDTTGANEKDSLMEISFHIPNSNTQFVGDESRPSAQVFRDKIVSMADVGAGGEEAVVTFDGIAILTPRGRYNVELHLSFLRLQGQANDFKIQYSSVVRVFWLPKYNQPHTFVVVTLDPPIRKGQTLYPHIVMQFETDAVIDTTLLMSEELYNTKYKDRLEPEHRGSYMRSLLQFCVVYLGQKLLNQGSSVVVKMVMRLKTEQEHLFRNIQRNEYHNLFSFVNDKGLKIMNLGTDQTTEGVASVINDIDDAVDPHLERIKNEAIGDESDEEDEDFVADKDDEGSPTDDSGGETDASDSGDEKEAPMKKKSKKEPSALKPSSSRKKTKDDDDDGSKRRKEEEEGSKCTKEGN